MSLVIASSTWPDVHKFWHENQALKSDITPLCIDEAIPVIFSDAFEYAKDKVIAAFLGDEVVGCVRIEAKHYGHLRIAALGKMAVDQEYRKNRIGERLLRVACLYMNQGVFDISVLWASVLHIYEQHGYVAIHKNMMVKYLKNCNVPISELRQIPAKIGAW